MSLCLLALCVMEAAAQSIVWQLQPTDYAELRPYSAGLFFIKHSGHTGLIRSDGTEVVPPVYDIIAPYHDGRALLLTHEGGNTAVGGYLTDDGRYVAFGKKYYTLTGIDFYSCGMLPVTDERGRKGYLDERGAEALGFNGTFDQLTPFSEGYAAVFRGKGKDKKYALIDRQGNPAAFRLGLGEVNSGTNVCNGKAIIWDTNGKFYTYDTNTRRCTETRRPSDTSLDYLYCFSGVSGRTRDIPYTYPTADGRTGLAPTMGANGLYGYSADGRQILPPQFSEASSFVDGIAIVKHDGRWGLLRWVENGTSFTLNTPKKEYSYESGEKVTCQFTLTIPETWHGKDVSIDVADATTGETISAQYDGNTYSFSLTPTTAGKEVTVSARADGLLLWTGGTSFAFHRIEPALKISIVLASTIADKNKHVPVTVTITNTGSESVTTEVHITGSATFVAKHETVTIPAKGQATLHSHFNIEKDVKGQYVNVTTSKGASASRRGLNLESYY